MRSAHQGIAVASLPGVADNPLTAFLPQAGASPVSVPRPSAGVPVPPAPVGGRQPPPQQPSPSLDGWLIDKLFGRR
jgi:penicillin-binding protein 1A